MEIEIATEITQNWDSCSAAVLKLAWGAGFNAAALREWRCFACVLQKNTKKLLNRGPLKGPRGALGGDFLSTLGWFPGSFHGVLGDLGHLLCIFCKNAAPINSKSRIVSRGSSSHQLSAVQTAFFASQGLGRDVHCRGDPTLGIIGAPLLALLRVVPFN